MGERRLETTDPLDDSVAAQGVEIARNAAAELSKLEKPQVALAAAAQAFFHVALASWKAKGLDPKIFLTAFAAQAEYTLDREGVQERLVVLKAEPPGRN